MHKIKNNKKENWVRVWNIMWWGKGGVGSLGSTWFQPSFILFVPFPAIRCGRMTARTVSLLFPITILPFTPYLYGDCLLMKWHISNSRYQISQIPTLDNCFFVFLQTLYLLVFLILLELEVRFSILNYLIPNSKPDVLSMSLSGLNYVKQKMRDR